MDTRQDDRKKVVIGYDLTDEYAQISYYFLEQDQPDTLRAYQGEKYNIPVCLCKKYGVNQWYYGYQALSSAHDGKGSLFTKLLTLATESENVTVEEKTVATKDLLFLFVRKCLGMLGMLMDGFFVDSVIMTVPTLTQKNIGLFEQLRQELPYDKDKIFIQSHEESLFYYIINQKKELWNYDVAVFDYSLDKLCSFYFSVNRKTMPSTVRIEKEVFSSFPMPPEESQMIDPVRIYESLDQRFLELLEKYTKGRIISSVYLIGKGFDGGWYQDSLAFLCKTRRVFAGNNLYSKGACYCAKEKLLETDLTREYLFLGKDKLKENIGVRSLESGKEICFPLLDAGINWYEARYEDEFLLDEGDTLEFVITSLYGEQKVHLFKLDGIAERPPKTTRLLLQLEMKSVNQLHIHVKDRGFGNFFLPSDKEWEGSIEI